MPIKMMSNALMSSIGKPGIDQTMNSNNNNE